MGIVFQNGVLLGWMSHARDGSLRVDGDRIVAIVGKDGPCGKSSTIAPEPGDVVVQLRGRILAPGFIDLHTHGALGVDFCEPDGDALERALPFYHARGVTGILITLYPATVATAVTSIRAATRAIGESRGRGIALGIYLEGPFLSRSRPGALPLEHFRAFDEGVAREIVDSGEGLVKVMTIAPEEPGGMDAIGFLCDRGIRPSLGHSAADYPTAVAAFDAGVHHVTHVFNAMEPVHHTAPGALAAALIDDRVGVEIIADGVHVVPPLIRLLARLKPAGRTSAISDSVAPSGLRDGVRTFAGRQVRVQRGRISLADGTLAGSGWGLDQALRVMVKEARIPLPRAVAMLTANPAEVIGCGRDRGHLQVGCRADLVVLSQDLRVDATYHGGVEVYRRGKGGKPG